MPRKKTMTNALREAATARAAAQFNESPRVTAGDEAALKKPKKKKTKKATPPRPTIGKHKPRKQSFVKGLGMGLSPAQAYRASGDKAAERRVKIEQRLPGGVWLESEKRYVRPRIDSLGDYNLMKKTKWKGISDEEFDRRWGKGMARKLRGPAKTESRHVKGKGWQTRKQGEKWPTKWNTGPSPGVEVEYESPTRRKKAK